MADKYWWEKVNAQDNSQGNWWDNGSISNEIGSAISNRVNTWLQNHNNYVSNYQVRNKDRKYSYDDSYVSDSASWMEDVKKRKSESDTEYDNILAYIDQNKSYFNEDWLKEIKDKLTEAKTNQGKILESAISENDYWNSFGSEELVKEYGSAEEAYKYFQRADGYSKKHSGLTTYSDVKKVLETLEDGEENDWLTSYGAQLDLKEKGALDIGAAEAELEAMKEFANKAYTIDIWYNLYEANPDAWSDEEI